ncbi:hypothetical protein P154DRAFT_487472 [Amniculicola lignicola CBS 123094]|uniref:Cytokinesis regulator n=1 Tax=Amniculicola lignicola CBS 123094 TaxID=1392246 RepID=A0A6A5WM78_9PLEO|nr:hypothetical protein P154DRAFT_487472 [Amniculicola lignicola CBS 123094]
MSTARGSFAQRIASMARSTAGSALENWDDDGDLQGDIFAASASTMQSLSSRVSVRSESNTGDDDWQVLLTPNDELSTLNAITSAKQAGIPIPTSVPSSALLAGPIRRLGKKNSNRKIVVDDDWGDDLELPSNPGEGLKLKAPLPRTPADDQDDFDDWGEGSLGIRFAGTRRDHRGGRSSSVSAMSPSIGSCMTLESEDDDLAGLVLPTEPLDFNARLDKLKKAELTTPAVSPLPLHHLRKAPPTSAPALEHTPSPAIAPQARVPSIGKAPTPELAPKAPVDEEDFLDGLDFGTDDLLDVKKPTLNRNVVVKKPSMKSVAPPAARPATTLTFTDKPTVSRIPRPLPSTSRTRLTPVYESGASTIGHNRQMPTTTSAQYLKAKRSAPALRSTLSNVTRSTPFLPAGTSGSQSHHITSKSSQPHLRRDSDPRRPQSPAMVRSHSRMSSTNPPDTPSRTGMRKDMAPIALAREAASKRWISKPMTRTNKAYGDGTELEVFDDLPTSATKEKPYEKAPRNVASNRSLRQQPSITRMPVFDRTATATPLPQTPRSPTKMDSTPRFARDTAASRIAREQRLAGTRSRGDGPIAPSTHTNWKAQVAARSPHTSPTAQRKKGSGQKPMLIRAMSALHSTSPLVTNYMSIEEKGMVFNPSLQRWDGNEEALVQFSHPNTSTTTLALTTASTPTFAPPGNPFHAHDRSHSISHTALSNIHQKSISSRAVKVGPVPSPPRAAPALISHKTTQHGVQVQGNMVFDPEKMRWFKMPRLSGGSRDPRSPSVDIEDEEDPFAGLEDLKDKNEPSVGAGSTGHGGVKYGGGPSLDEPFINEEFDVGPSFVRRHRDEEAQWRKRVDGWVGQSRDTGENRHTGYRWAIRKMAAEAANLR